MDGATINKDNGYGGAIDPMLYLPKDFDKLPANKFYGKPRNWLAEFYLRFAPIGINNQWTITGRYIHRELKKRGWVIPILSGKMINAIIYGSWDFESVMNPLLEPAINYLTKADFEKGEWFPQLNR